MKTLRQIVKLVWAIAKVVWAVVIVPWLCCPESYCDGAVEVQAHDVNFEAELRNLKNVVRKALQRGLYARICRQLYENRN